MLFKCLIFVLTTFKVFIIQKSTQMKLEITQGLFLDFEGVNNLNSVQEVGIENLKKVAEFSIRLRKRILRYKADGTINWFERVGLGLSIVGVVKLISFWDLIKAEILDLDADEYNELIKIVAIGFDADPELALDYFGSFIEFMDGFKSFLIDRLN